MLAAALALVALPAAAHGSERPIFAALIVNGSEISGDVSLNELDGMDLSSDHIECFAVNHEIFDNSTDGSRSSGLTHAPFKFVKPVDKSSPIFYQVLGNNLVVEGTFKYFRPQPVTGEPVHFYSVTIEQGRVTGIRHWSPSSLDSAAQGLPNMEEVSLTYQRLTITDESTGATYFFDLSSEDGA